MEWGKAWLIAHPVTALQVLEAGSLNINGSLRQIAESQQPTSYLGIDVTAGVGVDRVVSAHKFKGQLFDAIISTEMLEHVEDWRGALTALKQLLKPGGWLLLTTRSPGQMRHEPAPDCWRFTESDIAAALSDMDHVTIEPDPAGCGVFATAFKPLAFNPCDLSAIKPEATK